MDHLIDVIMDFLELLLNYLIIASLSVVLRTFLILSKGQFESISLFSLLNSIPGVIHRILLVRFG
jgi:hypothetical protein